MVSHNVCLLQLSAKLSFYICRKVKKQKTLSPALTVCQFLKDGGKSVKSQCSCYMIVCINTSCARLYPLGCVWTAPKLQHGQSAGSASCWGGGQKMAPVQWTQHEARERPLLLRWSNVACWTDFSRCKAPVFRTNAGCCIFPCWTNFRTTIPPVFPFHDPVFPPSTPIPLPLWLLLVCTGKGSQRVARSSQAHIVDECRFRPLWLVWEILYFCINVYWL